MTTSRPSKTGLKVQFGRAHVSLAIQILQSVTSMSVSFILMPALGPDGFGALMLALAIQLFLLGIVDSGMLTPLNVKSAHKDANDKVNYFHLHLPHALTASAVLAFTGYAIAQLLAWTLNFGEGNVQLLIAAMAFGSFSLCAREYLRHTLLVDRRFKRLFVLEFTVSLAMVLAIALLSRAFPGSITAGNAVLAIALVNGLYLIATAFAWPANDKNVDASTGFLRLLRQGTKSLASAKITWLQSQTYVYFVNAMVSAAALGLVSAARMLFSPLQTIFAGLSRGLLPDMASHFANGRIIELRRILRKCYLWSITLGLAWTGGGVALFPHLFHLFAASEFTPDSVMTASWGAVFLASGLRSIGTLGLKAAGRFDLLVTQGILGAAIAITAVPALIFQYGAIGALWGLLAAESLAFAFSAQLLKAVLRAKDVDPTR